MRSLLRGGLSLLARCSLLSRWRAQARRSADDSIKPAPAFSEPSSSRRRPWAAGSPTAATCPTSATRPLTADQSRQQSSDLKAVWRTHLNGSRHGRAALRPGAAAHVRRRALHGDRPGRCVRDQCRDGQDSLELQGEPRPQPRESVLRLGEPRRRRSATARSSSASSTRKLVALDQRTGKVAVVHPGRRSTEGLQHRRRAAVLRRHGHRRHRRRRHGHPRAASRPSTRRPASCSGRSTRFRPRASSAATPGRPTTTSGNSAAPRSGRPRRSIRSSGLIYFSTGNAGSTLQRVARARATTCSPPRSSPSMRRPASTAGTSNRCITTSGTTTRPTRWCCSTRRIDGKTRKALAQVSKTGWVYILDRATGKPLLGIEEKPVPQEPRQHTAATQPYPVGDCGRAAVHRHCAGGVRPASTAAASSRRSGTSRWSTGRRWPSTGRRALTIRTTHLFYVCGIDNVGNSVSDAACASSIPSGRACG